MSRDAVKLVQTLLDSMGHPTVVDGAWGSGTQRSWNAASQSTKDYISERVAAVSGERVSDLVRSSKVPAPATKTPSGKGSLVGWEGRLWGKASAAGMPDSTVRSLIGQVKKETGGRLMVSEMSSSYSASWLQRKMRVFKDWSADQIRKLQAAGEEAFFNTMYGGRLDLGNRGVSSGDGFKYRGRGALQLTGRYNYERVGKLLGVDLVSDPDWVIRSEDNAIAASLAYLKLQGKLHASLSPAQMQRVVNPGLA